VGSLLCGPRAFIDEARRNRKMLGGGMRQAGVIAAAGIYALDHHIRRLSDDHANAALLAEGLRAFPTFVVSTPQTNIVMVDVPGSADAWQRRLADAGVLVTIAGRERLRLVTHLDVTDGDIREALARVSRAAA
jgi:threonine aldolase